MYTFLMESQRYGKFSSFAKFIESYEAEQLLLAKKERDVVEVSATIDVREPDDTDGDRHIRLRVRVTEVLHDDPDVAADIKRNIDAASDVFVAIRYGDQMGLPSVPPGLDAGAQLRLKGEWIPREHAQNHGGEAMSVLHFTHHPIGFICTPDKCFS